MIPPSHDEDNLLPRTPDLPAGANPREIAEQWISQLNTRLADDSPDLSGLLHEDSWWRDMLAFDWDLHTLRGLDKISDYVAKHQPRALVSKVCLATEPAQEPVLETPREGTSWVRAIFHFSTYCGTGTGVAYLTLDENSSEWKAFAVYTSLQQLHGREDRAGRNRAEGTTESMPGGIAQGTWIERRRRAMEFADEEPTVLVVGAGQAGLNVSARLQSMGVPCLIIEQNRRVGDNWRNRYRTLVTHDHVNVTHLAYLPFPDTWPKYSSKDKLGDWFEAYASLMELNVWLESTIQSAEYDEAKQAWSVTVLRKDKDQARVVRPSHVIWCTGQFDVEKVPHLPTQPLFQGTVYHSKHHRDAALLNPRGKKVVVVGTGNTGHDIAQDFYENGAQVTLLQRGSSYVLGQAGLPLLPENEFVEDASIPLEVVDLLSESLPWPVALDLLRDNTRQITEADRDLLKGLEKSGFKLNHGPSGQGIIGLFAKRGGGYYIDFGCSQLIVDGKVQVKQCAEGVVGFDEHHLLLGDGGRLEADIVVLATGYHGPLESVRRVLGPAVAARCNKQVWGLDETGEFHSVWRPSGHPGFWFMGGNLAQTRVYSRFLALQVAATHAGLVGPR
ncbi:flavin-containing monooxygenase [Aspergillus mulundensis]|uniref:Flavin-containing monooxygenase n=1 Tax=Aspergillus mulundensis TaxID=1810919 RepID=A0A3D8QV56_9EURO|nr:hypothetical protein DSM5745_09394 [Aspergillus mulundensis]RDW65655.1 hypothetical protein DSM5745_09394 [Aspergillus mulundensis]